MFDPALELLAEEVRRDAGIRAALPVSLETLCDYEDIALQPLQNHKGFHGKIEFYPEHNAFAIYHPDPASYQWPNRIRFSIAHELGHYHIDEHRAALVRGETHNSIPGFRSDDVKERQADEFAAALLIPRAMMVPKIEKRGFLQLSEILIIARDCAVSPYATTIRYVRMASEACVVVLAKEGKIQNSFYSDEARAKYLSRLVSNELPAASPGSNLKWQQLGGEPVEVEHKVESWFNARRDEATVWENCVGLGQGFTLSLIALEFQNEDEDE